MYQPAPGSVVNPPSINIYGTQLKSVNQFKYLGSVISSGGTLGMEIEACINKASQLLHYMHSHMMSHRNIKLTTKIKMNRAVVHNSLLYGCEMWTLYRKHLKQLEHFHMRSLRSIIGIKWQYSMANTEVLDRCKPTSIRAMILRAVSVDRPCNLNWQLLYTMSAPLQSPHKGM